MEFSDKLINPETDAEIYAEACPTLGTLMLARYSTPSRHHEAIYGADGLFFATFPERRMYLRPAYAGEFDPFNGWDEFKKMPTLWVLVLKLSDGFHEHTPRWRGNNFWTHHGTDEQTAATLVEIAERGALKLSEWYGYVSDKRNSNRDARRKAN
jgi:hypothetical protein